MRQTILLCAVAVAATFQAAPRERAGDTIVVENNVAAPMRDGVVLRADVYRPAGSGRYPALVQRTPYSKNDDGAPERFKTLAARGYVVVVQDTRGRYMSDGIARPHDEAEDGFDTLAWVAGLPYVNGKTAMWGGSYLATTQLLAATLQPPSLVALFPSSSYASRYDMVFQGGAFYLNDGLGWNLGQSADVRRRLLTPDADRDGPIGLGSEQSKALRERWLWHVPLETMDALELRRFAPGYFEMLSHPSFDDYWRTFDVAARHDRFEVPAFHLTGWYDTLVSGTLANFSGLRARAATERARQGQRLIVGPWTHARPTRSSTKVGDVDFGPEAGLDSQDLVARWFDYWLKDGDPSVVNGAPVRIFVMGENKWRDEQEWPLARARSTTYFLHGAGRANTLDGDGRLSVQSPGDQQPDTFVYDPWDPVPTGALGGYSRIPSDQTAIERRPDVLVYTTDALTSDVEVTGPLSLTLWVASSATDTDFTGKLLDVWPDGTARPLNDGILRLRYRNGKATPQLLTPDEPVQVTIDLGATSNLFRAGHRIRLEVSSSNFPRFDRNPNTGRAFGEDGELRRARQRVFHDSSRPSFVTLPIVPR
jgi:putative CocE/NonD family hydrolase